MDCVKNINLFLDKYYYLHCSVKFWLIMFFVSLTCWILDSELNSFNFICTYIFIYMWYVRVCTDFYISKSLKKKINECMVHDIYLKNSVISVYLYPIHKAFGWEKVCPSWDTNIISKYITKSTPLLWDTRSTQYELLSIEIPRDGTEAVWT